MKMYFLLLSIIGTCLLTGCQGTASGFTNDVSRNTDTMRREINEN